jgi:hypothetical protein
VITGESIRSGLFREPFCSLGVFAAVLGITAMMGFDGWLYRDDSIYSYIAQQVASGRVPYVDAFDHKTPLAGMLGAVFVLLGRVAGMEDIYALRAGFWILTGLTGVVVYHLGRIFYRNALAGGFCAVVLSGFFNYGREAASGPNAKTAFVLAESCFLLLAARRQWFLAGVAGALACWVWQPGVFFALGALLLALLSETGHRRWRAALWAIAGVLLPTVILFAWFWARGGLGALLEGSVFFKLNYLHRTEWSLLSAIWNPLATFYRTMGSLFLLVFPGIALLLWTTVRAFAGGERWSEASETRHLRRLIVVVIAFPVFWTLLDFQGAGDLYPFLPFLALGIGGLFWSMTRRWPAWAGGGVLLLLGVATGIQYRVSAEQSLLDQKASLAPLRDHFGEDLRLASIGAPQALVLLGKTNPSRFFYVIDGIDQKIDAEEPGGLEGWLTSLDTAGVEAIVFGTTDGPHRERIVQWLGRYYDKRRYGYYDVYIRNRVPLPADRTGS